MSKDELLCQSCRSQGGCSLPTVGKDDKCLYYIKKLTRDEAEREDRDDWQHYLATHD